MLNLQHLSEGNKSVEILSENEMLAEAMFMGYLYLVGAGAGGGIFVVSL